ncbi:ACT domain-containing protein [Endozoicomonas gorgoniicola]|uniref:ACT domain-containing protein n=1 Tax=Endozoicomonas gorgoniicola TaxID=1234144 RepID=A0ABT3MQB1_9GAMM|nr:ACT domain-containing protein [Endozoicomonas gorgoniicola]MCW7551537.1 ACT domain-containing protein [Endozoicomonas gorgoniicola]
MSTPLKLSVLRQTFSVHRFAIDNPVPPEVLNSEIYSVMRTDDELSIVCESSLSLNSDQAETDWSALKVTGPLDFSLTGILAGLATALAEADVSLFALSTYDTDYVLVKSKQLSQACMALNSAGYILENG